MKFLIVSFALLAVAFAQHQQHYVGVPLVTKPVAILKQTQDQSPEGSYNYNYETENGIAVSQTGQATPLGPNGEPVVVVQGQYQFTAPDGTPVAVSYVADQNGYQPTGDSLPVPPPVPEAIQRALAYIAAHPPKPEEQP
ncbi:endocuticle structural glycoprotein SgAbd-1-like [Prorops nasuta]|uniref:endocuticle structural glycoprotein SgAbd-1-like n=1 Tax=Prorops nasuta TaxID=863751 RepID=UPI0034CDF649